jgi:hypothetical protein
MFVGVVDVRANAGGDDVMQHAWGMASTSTDPPRQVFDRESVA